MTSATFNLWKATKTISNVALRRGTRMTNTITYQQIAYTFTHHSWIKRLYGQVTRGPSFTLVLSFFDEFVVRLRLLTATTGKPPSIMVTITLWFWDGLSSLFSRSFSWTRCTGIEYLRSLGLIHNSCRLPAPSGTIRCRKLPLDNFT